MRRLPKCDAPARTSSPARTRIGVRQPDSMTLPAAIPSTSALRLSCRSSTDRPSRPAASRSMRTCRYCTPSLRAVNTSSAPGIARSSASMRWEARPSSARSLPNTLTAMSPRTPVSISAMRISIGWVKVASSPGKRAATVRNWSVSHALSGRRHWAIGFSTRKLSLSFRPIGSRPSSSEPERATTLDTSGTPSRIARCRRESTSTVRSRLIDGSFSSCMIRSPSSMVGMKLLPSSA